MAHFVPRRVLLLALLTDLSGCIADLPLTETISASKEEDITLPCSDSEVMDPKSVHRLKWTKYDTGAGQGKVILALPKKNQDAQGANWHVDEKGHLFLLLTKLQKSDEGLYTCELCQGWECVLVQNISLKVKDCKTLSAVRTPPGTTGQLKCFVSATLGEGGPQNISWEMLKGGLPVSVNSKRVEINGTSLVIRSVSASDSGWYRCSYVDGQTQRCSETHFLAQAVPVTTTETPQELTKNVTVVSNRKEGSRATYVAVVASVVVVGVVKIALLAAVFVYCRCSAQRQPAGTPMQPVNGRGSVSLPSSDRTSTQQINSLYEEFVDETMCTFHY